MKCIEMHNVEYIVWCSEWKLYQRNKTNTTVTDSRWNCIRSNNTSNKNILSLIILTKISKQKEKLLFSFFIFSWHRGFSHFHLFSLQSSFFWMNHQSKTNPMDIYLFSQVSQQTLIFIYLFFCFVFNISNSFKQFV